jgi:hypothetical protein
MTGRARPTVVRHDKGVRWASVTGNLIVLASVVLTSCFVLAQQGSVCIAARVDDPFFKELPTLPNGQLNTHGLRIKIDDQLAMPWPDRKSLKIADLDTQERHLLVVLDSKGKPIESVRINLARFKTTNICMTYDGYQGIQLDDVTRHTPWCKCH